MPQSGAVRKTNPNSNKSNRRSQKRRGFSIPTPANDNNPPPSTINSPQIQPAANDNNQQTAPSPAALSSIGPSVPNSGAKLTGTGMPSSVKKQINKYATRSVGPKAIARPVNQTAMASRLAQDQQADRMAQSEDLGPTREEMLADSGDADSTVLPGQYDPLTQGNAYGRQAASPPGSMAETQADKDLSKEGGEMQTDLERQRAMQLEQQKMSQSASLTTAKQPSEAQASAKDETKTPAPQGEKKVFSAGGPVEGKGAAETEKAQQIAQAIGAERTAKALETVQNVRGNLEAAKKAAKAAKNVWNLIKTGELAAGVSVFSLVVLFITANLQMINKYTFKNRLVPETYKVEDFVILCSDCLVCGSACFNFYTAIIIFWVLIGALIILGSIYGLDYFGILSLVDLSF